jgi:hypothetical protein
LTRVRYLRSGRSALRRRLILRCRENNVRKLKNRYKFTWFVVAKICKAEVRKSRDTCICLAELKKTTRILLNNRSLGCRRDQIRTEEWKSYVIIIIIISFTVFALYIIWLG